MALPSPTMHFLLGTTSPVILRALPHTIPPHVPFTLAGGSLLPLPPHLLACHFQTPRVHCFGLKISGTHSLLSLDSHCTVVLPLNIFRAICNTSLLCHGFTTLHFWYLLFTRSHPTPTPFIFLTHALRFCAAHEFCLGAFVAWIAFGAVSYSPICPLLGFHCACPSCCHLLVSCLTPSSPVHRLARPPAGYYCQLTHFALPLDHGLPPPAGRREKRRTCAEQQSL